MSKSIIDIIESNKKVLRAEYQKGYLVGFKEAEKRTISEFLNDIKYRWNKIITKLTEISENLGLKAEFYFPINDNFGELQEKWEGKLK